MTDARNCGQNMGPDGERPPDWWRTAQAYGSGQQAAGMSQETRIALVEQRIGHVETYARDRLQAHSARISEIPQQIGEISERVRKVGSRVGRAEDQLSHQAATLAKIDPLAATVAEMVARSKERRTITQWAAAAAVPLVSLLLIAAGILGKIDQKTVDAALPQIRALSK